MGAQPQTDDTPWTTGRLLAWTNAYLERHGIAESRLASEVLLARATGQRRIDLYAGPDEVPDQESVGRFRAWVKRAARHEPVAYIVGEKEFFSLSFAVTPDVLIPRPETETLVENVVDHCRANRLPAPDLLDLGTGSGCMAITVLVHLAGARVVATDVSREALAVAKGNAERHGVGERFTAVEADRLALPEGAVPDGGFDVLMSNPPYVTSDAVGGLDPAVRDFEPLRAVTDGGDGLSFYRSIAVEAPSILAAKGVVFVEVDDGAAQSVIGIMESAGALAHQRTWKDSVMGRERVLLFSRR